MPSFETLLNGDVVVAGKAVPCRATGVGPSHGDVTAVVGDRAYPQLPRYQGTLSGLRGAVLRLEET